jgi:hypothetical protein
LTKALAWGPRGWHVLSSKSVITNWPSIGFFGPHTFQLVPVVVVETEGYVGRNKIINKGIIFEFHVYKHRRLHILQTSPTLSWSFGSTKY